MLKDQTCGKIVTKFAFTKCKKYDFINPGGVKKLSKEYHHL